MRHSLREVATILAAGSGGMLMFGANLLYAHRRAYRGFMDAPPVPLWLTVTMVMAGAAGLLISAWLVAHAYGNMMGSAAWRRSEEQFRRPKDP